MPCSTKARVDYCTNDPCGGSGFYYDPGWTRFKGHGRDLWARRLTRGDARYQPCPHGVVLTNPPIAPGARWCPFSGYCVAVPDEHTWPATGRGTRVAGQEQRTCPADRRLVQVQVVPRVRRTPSRVDARRGPRLSRRVAAA